MASLNILVSARTGVSKTFVDAAVSTSAETISLPGHCLDTGDLIRFSNSGGTLPAPLVATQHYYVINASVGTIKVATSAANATAGTAVNLTSAAGGGTHTVKLVEKAFTDLTKISTANATDCALALSQYFQKQASGTANGPASIQISEECDAPVAATGTITITHANVTDADTVTIGGTVITAKTSASDDTIEWTIGANATADATALAATINKNLTLSRIMTASSSSGVVTLTMKVKGVIGNSITLATSDATAFALVAMASGAGGACNTVSTYSLGL
jgi:hypothetical protein